MKLELDQFMLWIRDRSRGCMEDAEVDAILQPIVDGDGDCSFEDPGLQAQWEAWQAGRNGMRKWANDAAAEIDRLQAAITPPGIDQALLRLRGDREHFRAILVDSRELLAKVCDYAETRGARQRVEPWSVIGEITSHGSGVSSAIYELYRRKPAAVAEGGSAP